MAQCSPNSLLSDGACFSCLSPRQLKIVQAQLLCDIEAASGVSGVLQQEFGPVSGWADPPDTSVSYLKWNASDGIVYAWNVNTLAWEPTA